MNIKIAVYVDMQQDDLDDSSSLQWNLNFLHNDSVNLQIWSPKEKIHHNPSQASIRKIITTLISLEESPLDSKSHIQRSVSAERTCAHIIYLVNCNDKSTFLK